MSDPECEVQRPIAGEPRYLECNCVDVERGGCCCADDGTVNGRVHFEAAEHEPGGFPRRTRAGAQPRRS